VARGYQSGDGAILASLYAANKRLGAEVERLRAENAALAEKQCALMEANRAISNEQLAELKRFREREEKVRELLANASAERYFEVAEAHLQERRRLVAAVRDFKL
jgi:hypothetical protein